MSLFRNIFKMSSFFCPQSPGGLSHSPPPFLPPYHSAEKLDILCHSFSFWHKWNGLFFYQLFTEEISSASLRSTRNKEISEQSSVGQHIKFKPPRVNFHWAVSLGPADILMLSTCPKTNPGFNAKNTLTRNYRLLCAVILQIQQNISNWESN